MNVSIVPIYLALVFLFCFFVARRASIHGVIDRNEERQVTFLLVILILWAVLCTVMGLNNLHIILFHEIPVLWQAFVPVGIWVTAILLSAKLRSGLLKIAMGTPVHWFILLQSLRLGAVGGIIKGLNGEIVSNYVFWIGIPDFLFGLSALIIGFLMLYRIVSGRLLAVWHLVGFSLIFFPTFGIMNYWMSEPGFIFIFEYPMILAPSILVPMLISINLLHAWGLLEKEREGHTHLVES